MTVAEAIKELQKIEDKSIHIFTDCPNCGRANAIRKLDIVAVVRAEQPTDRARPEGK